VSFLISLWVLAAWGLRETWVAGLARAVTGRRLAVGVLPVCRRRRRDRFQGAGGCAGVSSGLVCVARGSAAGHDRGVLPV